MLSYFNFKQRKSKDDTTPFSSVPTSFSSIHSFSRPHSTCPLTFIRSSFVVVGPIVVRRHGSLIKDNSFNAGTGAVTLGDMEPLQSLQRKFSISACRRQSSIDLLAEHQFLLTIDGGRFDSSQFTLKFHTNTFYKIYVKTKPTQNFLSLNIGGNDLKLDPIEGGSGEYVAIWNTADKEPTKKGTRRDIEFVLSGPDKTLNKKLQVKFYSHNDTHAGWGQKLDQITWHCSPNDVGQVFVLEEQTL
uniref:CB1 cannabinoid receptor-interacting protein 1 n=1 Tax=Globodera rostochiensis TaxID=31243 RepID=A0A914IA16_GLORO